MDVTVPRRAVLLGVAAGLLPGALRAEDVVALEWTDLLPRDQEAMPPALRGIVQHDGADLAAAQPRSTGTRDDWNGRTVSLSGFVVPLDYAGTGVTAFILVPYAGACVHVPPPPANQLVFVTTRRPWESGGLFEPVTVTGTFGTASNETELADIGYALDADRIRPFEG